MAYSSCQMTKASQAGPQTDRDIETWMINNVSELSQQEAPRDFILDSLDQEVRDLDFCMICEKQGPNEMVLRPIMVRVTKCLNNKRQLSKIEYYFYDDLIQKANYTGIVKDESLIKLNNPEFFLSNKHIAQLLCYKASIINK